MRTLKGSMTTQKKLDWVYNDAQMNWNKGPRPNARFFFSLHPSASLSFWQHDNHNSTRPCQTQFSFFLACLLAIATYLSTSSRRFVKMITLANTQLNSHFMWFYNIDPNFSLFLLSSVRLLSADIVYPISEHKSEAMLCIGPSSCPIGVSFFCI